MAPKTQTSTYQHSFPLFFGGTWGAADAGASGSLKLHTSISKPSLKTTSIGMGGMGIIPQRTHWWHVEKLSTAMGTLINWWFHITAHHRPCPDQLVVKQIFAKKSSGTLDLGDGRFSELPSCQAPAITRAVEVCSANSVRGGRKSAFNTKAKLKGVECDWDWLSPTKEIFYFNNE